MTKQIMTAACLILIVAQSGCSKPDQSAKSGSSNGSSNAPVAGAANGKTGSTDAYPTFTEGGALNLTVQGQPVTIPISSVILANTDGTYPDYMEIDGTGTHLCVLIDPKMPDGEGDPYYKPVVGRSLSLKVPEDLVEGAREITIPGQGKYPVAGGNLTMEKYQIGMNGRDSWEGRIEVLLQTTQGPVTVPGTFKMCVVPTW